MRAVAAAAACLLACGGSSQHAASPDERSCRDVARRAQALIAAEPPRERGPVLRFFAGALDLCQAPGLSASTRACLFEAHSVAIARGCPSVPSRVEPAEQPPQPTCRGAVDHAMKLLDADPHLRPTTADDRRSERQSYQDDCEELNDRGLRCLLAAKLMAEVDRCLDDAGNQRPHRDSD